jgi:hypothetical protein
VKEGLATGAVRCRAVITHSWQQGACTAQDTHTCGLLPHTRLPSTIHAREGVPILKSQTADSKEDSLPMPTFAGCTGAAPKQAALNTDPTAAGRVTANMAHWVMRPGSTRDTGGGGGAQGWAQRMWCGGHSTAAENVGGQGLGMIQRSSQASRQHHSRVTRAWGEQEGKSQTGRGGR